jgi:hypothetical protein
MIDPIPRNACRLVFIISGIMGAMTSSLWSAPAVILSELWGLDGEKWTPKSRLPDFSFAGYHAGEAALPDLPVKGNVKDFGAKGDGITDDTQAFLKGIEAVAEGTLLVPKGRYIITDVLPIEKSHFVLRGAGPESTSLVFPKSLKEIQGVPPGINWSWNGGFLAAGLIHDSLPSLAAITAPAQRGESQLKVSTTTGLLPGDWIEVVIEVTDPQDSSLWKHIHAENANAPSGGPDKGARTMAIKIVFDSKIKAISSDQITLERPLRTDIRTGWNPRIFPFAPDLQEIGIENLKFEFPPTRSPNHWEEPGFNAIEFIGIANSWVRHITINNGDMGIKCGGCRFSTFSGIRFTADSSRINKSDWLGHTGHHALYFSSSRDNLISEFKFETKFIHDISVDSKSNGNVFGGGKGLDINFDHHTNMSYENLFTDIDVGAGNHIWECSGSNGPFASARETFWGITAHPYPSDLVKYSNPSGWPQINIIGMGLAMAAKKTLDRAWIEPLEPANLQPKNLYLAQLANRLRSMTPINFEFKKYSKDQAQRGFHPASSSLSTNLLGRFFPRPAKNRVRLKP